MKATLARWQKIWHDQDMGYRLVELGQSALWYFLITLFAMGAAGAWAVRLLPDPVVQPAVSFLASLYTLILLLTVAHKFSTSHREYLLGQIPEILDELRDLKMKEGLR